MKLTALALVTAGFPAHVNSGPAAVVAGPVATQPKLPVVALVVANAGLIVVHVAPPSRLRSMATFSTDTQGVGERDVLGVRDAPADGCCGGG